MDISNLIGHLRKTQNCLFFLNRYTKRFQHAWSRFKKNFLGTIPSYYYITFSNHTRLQKKVLEKLFYDNIFHVSTMDICIYIYPSLDGHDNWYVS